MEYDRYCMSSYLAFRYVVSETASWRTGLKAAPIRDPVQSKTVVNSSEEVLEKLRSLTKAMCASRRVGLLLSGGIDSAILAAIVPKDCVAYTVRFVGPGAIDETADAKVFADFCGLEHRIVEVTWQDYESHTDHLMLKKGSPLHALGVAIYKAAACAHGEGVQTLLVGNGADSTFGGMDKLLCKDWGYQEFIRRYTYVEPSRVLRDPKSIEHVYATYKRGDTVDVQGFLKTVHGRGIIQVFDNSISAADCVVEEPYEHLHLGIPLDMNRIRSGEPKYILRKVFADLYPGWEIPDKIAFARPMDAWLSRWKGPTRREFLPNSDLDQFTGEQKWLIFCMERFLNLMDRTQQEKAHDSHL